MQLAINRHLTCFPLKVLVFWLCLCSNPFVCVHCLWFLNVLCVIVWELQGRARFIFPASPLISMLWLFWSTTLYEPSFCQRCSQSALSLILPTLALNGIHSVCEKCCSFLQVTLASKLYSSGLSSRHPSLPYPSLLSSKHTSVSALNQRLTKNTRTFYR